MPRPLLGPRPAGTMTLWLLLLLLRELVEEMNGAADAGRRCGGGRGPLRWPFGGSSRRRGPPRRPDRPSAPSLHLRLNDTSDK